MPGRIDENGALVGKKLSTKTTTRKVSRVLRDVNVNRPRTRSVARSQKYDVEAHKPKTRVAVRSTSPSKSADDAPKLPSKRGTTETVVRKVVRKEAPKKPNKKKRDLRNGQSEHVNTSKRSRTCGLRSNEIVGQRLIERARLVAPDIFHSLQPQPSHTLAPNSFDPLKYTFGLSSFDAPNAGVVLQTPDYAADIFQRLYECETRSCLRCYIQIQNDINANMRALLVDWMVDVHTKLRLCSESLHLAVNIVDRYLMSAQVDKSELQLVGVTSLLLASKYEDVYPPSVKDCVLLTARAYTKQEVIDMELMIVKELDFNLTVVTCYPFLQRFFLITNAANIVQSAATYYCERLLLEHDSLSYRPSAIAAAAICLALNHPGLRDYDDEVDSKKPGVPQDLLDYSGYSWSLMFEIAEFIAIKVAEHGEAVRHKRHLKGVNKKFSRACYHCVSTNLDPPDAIDIIDD